MNYLCESVCTLSCITEAAVTVSVEALVSIVIGRSCLEGCGFDSHYRPGSFLRFNSRPIMSSPYCARRVRLLSVLKLWPIVETSVMCENNGITVRQTVAHTIQLRPHELGMPCGSRLSIIRSVSKPSSRISSAGPYDTTAIEPGEEYNL